MKKIFLFLLPILHWINSIAQPTFQKVFGTHLWDDVGQVVHRTNGDLLISGTTNGYGAAGNIILLCIDSSGNYKWVKNFFGVGSDNGYSLIKDQNGGFSIAGSTASFGTGGFDGIFITTDSSGNVLRTKTYGTAAGYDEFTCIEKFTSGYVIGGYGSNSQRPMIVKTDTAGTILWGKTYSGSMAITRSIHHTNDGGIVFLAGYDNVGGGFTIAKLNSSGNLAWARQYLGTGYTPAYKMIPTSDNGYIVTGSTDMNASGAVADIFLFKADSLGNKMWSKIYGGIFSEYGCDVIETSDGGYAVTGYTNSFGFGDKDAFLLKTNSTGVCTWAKTYGDEWIDWGKSLTQTPDRGYAVAGIKTMNGTNWDSLEVFLAKADSLGNTPCNDTAWQVTTQTVNFTQSAVTYTIAVYGSVTSPTMVSNSKSMVSRDLCPHTLSIPDHGGKYTEVRISPNPFSTSTEIHLPLMPNASLLLYNNFGQVVRELKDIHSRESMTIDRNGLSPGIYFMQIIQNGEMIATEKLVIVD
jgi:hypothetical protein